MDSNLCMFCLKDNRKGKLHQVVQDSMVRSISARNRVDLHGDHQLYCRLDADLIALEAKYHVACLTQFRNNTKHVEDPAKTASSEDCFSELITQVDQELLARKTLKINDLTERINQILFSNFPDSAHRPTPYRNDKMKKKLLNHYGDRIEIHSPLNKRDCEFIYSSHISLSSVLNLTEKGDPNVSIPPVFPSEDAILTYAAITLKNAMNSCVDVSTMEDLSWQKVQEIVPCKLKLFLDELASKPEESSARVHSIAQDIISLTKCVRTPKSVSLAVMVKHMTNNSSLIDYLHKLGHSISYKDTLALDNNIADTILDEASKVGMVIPTNITSRCAGGGFIQAAADNIDFTEETLDGKNTTHATSMVLYQHGASELPLHFMSPKTIEKARNVH